jgi:hypothetical protein
MDILVRRAADDGQECPSYDGPPGGRFVVGDPHFARPGDLLPLERLDVGHLDARLARRRVDVEVQDDVFRHFHSQL